MTDRSKLEVRNGEALVYDLSIQELAPNDFDRLISEAIYKNKAHLGPRGMIECALVLARDFERQSAMWQPIDANTPPPVDKPVLLWFIGLNAPKAAPACAIGSVSSNQHGEVWIDGDYRPIEWFSHWRLLPDGPS